MLAVYGVLVIAVTILLFTLTILVFRRPNPPAWTKNGVVEQSVALAFTVALAVGFGLGVQFFFTFKDNSFGAVEGTLEVGLVVGIVVAAVVIFRLINPTKKLREYEQATAPAAKGSGTGGAHAA
jgi:xanthine/uracil permease